MRGIKKGNIKKSRSGGGEVVEEEEEFLLEMKRVCRSLTS